MAQAQMPPSAMPVHLWPHAEPVEPLGPLASPAATAPKPTAAAEALAGAGPALPEVTAQSHKDTAALAEAAVIQAPLMALPLVPLEATVGTAAMAARASAARDPRLAADPIRCLCHMPLQLPTLALVAVVVAAHAVGALRSISALGAAAVEAVAAVEVAGVLEQVLVVVEAVCAKPSAAVLLCLRQLSVANAMAVARMVDADLLSLGPVVHIHVESHLLQVLLLMLLQQTMAVGQLVDKDPCPCLCSLPHLAQLVAVLAVV